MSAAVERDTVEAFHEEDSLGKVYDRQLISRLWRYVWPYRGQVALTLFLVLPLFLIELAPAWIIKTGIERVMTPVAGLSEVSGPAFQARIFEPPGQIAPAQR